MFNIQGMNPSAYSKSSYKLEYIKEELSSDENTQVAAVAISEHWLKSHITDAQIHIPKYQVVRADRKISPRGGALLYVHEDYPIINEETFDNDICQLAVCTIKSSDTIIASIYRPPDTPDEQFSQMMEFLQEYIDKSSKANHMDLLVLGDFNLPVINWKDISIQKCYNKESTESAKTLLTFMEKNFMSQYVDVPTRYNNTLDLCLANTDQLVLHVDSEKLKLSDHNIVRIRTKYPLNSTPKVITPPSAPHSFRSLNTHKADFDQIKTHLQEVNWDELRESCSAEEFPELLKLTVLQICELYIPNKKLSNKPENKHSRNRRILRRNKRNLQNSLNMQQTLTPAQTRKIQKTKDKLEEIHTKIKASIEDQRIEEERRAVQAIKKNPRYFFSYCKKHAKSKSNIGPLLDPENKLQNDPKKMANLLQNQYSSVFSDPKSKKKKSPKIEQIANEILENITFTTEDIEKAISEINTYSACAEDDIPTII